MQILKTIPTVHIEQDRVSPEGNSNIIAVGIITNLDNKQRIASNHALSTQGKGQTAHQ